MYRRNNEDARRICQLRRPDRPGIRLAALASAAMQRLGSMFLCRKGGWKETLRQRNVFGTTTIAPQSLCNLKLG
jgi:hypothetical protein